MNNSHNSSLRVAIGGLISAFALVIMMCTGLMPIGTYAFPVFAGVLLIAVSVEFGTAWAMLVYVVISVLSMLFVADKEAALFFTLLFGYYPVLQMYIGKIKYKIVRLIIKLAIFNAAAVSIYFLMLFVFGLPADAFVLFGVNIPLVFLLIGNIAFLLYDYCIPMLINMYLTKYRSMIFRQ